MEKTPEEVIAEVITTDASNLIGRYRDECYVIDTIIVTATEVFGEQCYNAGVEYMRQYVEDHNYVEPSYLEYKKSLEK